MKVRELMQRTVQTCSMTESLNRAAQLMWEQDIGCVPVVDEQKRVIGMITDRDICMASYTRGGALLDHPVSSAMSRRVISCEPEERIADAEAKMRAHQVRRLPVIDQGRLVGVLSLNDLALASQQDGGRAKEVAQTLASICGHRRGPGKQTGKKADRRLSFRHRLHA